MIVGVSSGMHMHLGSSNRAIARVSHSCRGKEVRYVMSPYISRALIL